MTYWITTDSHFGHVKMSEYCNRPKDYEMLILENLVRILKPNDIIIHLGDFCFGGDKDWHSAFMAATYKCTKWFVRGNHDNKSNTWMHNAGWHFVGDSIGLNVYGKKIILSHIPIQNHTADVNIHGHLHNLEHRYFEKEEYIKSDKHYLVSLEKLNYQPIKLRTIIEKELK